LHNALHKNDTKDAQVMLHISGSRRRSAITTASRREGAFKKSTGMPRHSIKMGSTCCMAVATDGLQSTPRTLQGFDYFISNDVAPICGGMSNPVCAGTVFGEISTIRALHDRDYRGGPRAVLRGSDRNSVADTSATFPDGLKMILDATFIADAGG
jgi:hypothetical protein